MDNMFALASENLSRRSRAFLLILVGLLLKVSPAGMAVAGAELKAEATAIISLSHQEPQKTCLISSSAVFNGPTVASASATPSSHPAGETQDVELSTDSDLQVLIHSTRSSEWSRRWNAVNILGKLKNRAAIPALVERVLRDDNPHPRWRSLWALKATDPTGERVTPILCAALNNDPDPVVIRNAAVGLAYFGRPEARVELLRGLEDRDAFRRWEAIFSLRKIGSAAVTQALLSHLKAEREPEVRIRGEVALTLRYMGSEQVLGPLLDTLQTDSSPHVRWRAALTLSKVGNLSITQELKHILKQEGDPRVRDYIERTLNDIQKRSPGKK